MKFVLPGGSGQVGAALARALGGEGHAHPQEPRRRRRLLERGCSFQFAHWPAAARQLCGERIG